MSILARLSYTDATIAMTLGEPEAALAASRTAITRYRVLADALGIALAEGREATALLSLDRDAEAKAVLEEALGLARSVANGWVAAWILRLFGIVASDEGDLVGARRYVEEALRYHESVAARSTSPGRRSSLVASSLTPAIWSWRSDMRRAHSQPFAL